MEKKGLYDNIHAKRLRIKDGSGEKMRKPGTEGAPTENAFKKAAQTVKENYHEHEHESGEYDQEGSMAKSQLKNIINHANELHNLLVDESNLPEWVQSKLAVADDHITTISDYMKTEVQRKHEEAAKTHTGNVSEGVLTPVKAFVSARNAGKDAYKKELKANLPYVVAHSDTPGKTLELTKASKESAKDKEKFARKVEFSKYMADSRNKELEAKAQKAMTSYRNKATK
jgi:hypothetical protein